MILLYGRSPSGKTAYFMEQNKGQEVKIFHASNLTELIRLIISSESGFDDPMPTLINTWFDLNCKDILDFKNYDVYVESHYMESGNDLRIVQTYGVKHYYGLANENLISQKKLFFKKSKPVKNNVDWISILGTRYHYMQSMFPETIK